MKFKKLLVSLGVAILACSSSSSSFALKESASPALANDSSSKLSSKDAAAVSLKEEKVSNEDLSVSKLAAEKSEGVENKKETTTEVKEAKAEVKELKSEAKEEKVSSKNLSESKALVAESKKEVKSEENKKEAKAEAKEEKVSNKNLNDSKALVAENKKVENKFLNENVNVSKAAVEENKKEEVSSFVDGFNGAFLSGDALKEAVFKVEKNIDDLVFNRLRERDENFMFVTDEDRIYDFVDEDGDGAEYCNFKNYYRWKARLGRLEAQYQGNASKLEETKRVDARIEKAFKTYIDKGCEGSFVLGVLKDHRVLKDFLKGLEQQYGKFKRVRQSLKSKTKFLSKCLKKISEPFVFKEDGKLHKFGVPISEEFLKALADELGLSFKLISAGMESYEEEMNNSESELVDSFVEDCLPADGVSLFDQFFGDVDGEKKIETISVKDDEIFQMFADVLKAVDKPEFKDASFRIKFLSDCADKLPDGVSFARSSHGGFVLTRKFVEVLVKELEKLGVSEENIKRVKMGAFLERSADEDVDEKNARYEAVVEMSDGAVVDDGDDEELEQQKQRVSNMFAAERAAVAKVFDDIVKFKDRALFEVLSDVLKVVDKPEFKDEAFRIKFLEDCADKLPDGAVVASGELMTGVVDLSKEYKKVLLEELEKLGVSAQNLNEVMKSVFLKKISIDSLGKIKNANLKDEAVADNENEVADLAEYDGFLKFLKDRMEDVCKKLDAVFAVKKEEVCKVLVKVLKNVDRPEFKDESFRTKFVNDCVDKLPDGVAFVKFNSASDYFELSTAFEKVLIEELEKLGVSAQNLNEVMKSVFLKKISLDDLKNANSKEEPADDYKKMVDGIMAERKKDQIKRLPEMVNSLADAYLFS